MTELKPCPFCASSDVELRESIFDINIACNSCGCRTGLLFLGASNASNAAKKVEIIGVWNTRALYTLGQDYSNRAKRSVVNGVSHCRRGHAMTPDNIYQSNKYERCKACVRIANRAYENNQKERKKK